MSENAVMQVVQWRDLQGNLHETEDAAHKANERREREVAFKRKAGAVTRHLQAHMPTKPTIETVGNVIVRDWADMVKAVEWCPPYGKTPWVAVAKLVADDRELHFQPQISDHCVTKFVVENWALLRQIMEPLPPPPSEAGR